MIAMVKRGATRIPYKITKGDDGDMIDLAKLGRDAFLKGDKTTAEPVILGAILSKSADVAGFLAAAKEAGVEFDASGFKKAEADDVITFTKSDATAKPEETLVVRVSDDVAFVVKCDVEFQKSMSSYDWESTSFAEVMSKGQFAPSVCMAQDMLSRTFYNIMEKADTPKDLAAMLKAATGEFETYITGLAKGLPASIFKADKSFTKSEKSRKEAAAAFGKDKKDEDKKDVKKGDATDEPKKETRVGHDLKDPDELDGKTLKEQQAEADKGKKDGTVEDETGAKKVVEKAETPDFAKLIADGIAAGLKPVNDKIDALGTRIEKSEKAISGTVPGTDRPEGKEVLKSEVAGDDWTTGAPPLLDTAYGKRPTH
jgi:hypothetical protein